LPNTPAADVSHTKRRTFTSSRRYFCSTARSARIRTNQTTNIGLRPGKPSGSVSAAARAKVADLRIEQPTKFELVINLKPAKTLGFTIAPILATTDKVVE